MGLIYGRLGHFMRLHTIGFYTALGLSLIASSNSYAQTTPTSSGFGANGVFVQSVRSNSVAVSGSNVVSMQSFRVQNGTAPVRYFDRAVAYNKASYGSSVKGFMKSNAPNIALVGITLAMGWVLDQITKDLYTNGSVNNQMHQVDGYKWVANGTEYDTLTGAVSHMKNLYYPTYLPQVLVFVFAPELSTQTVVTYKFYVDGGYIGAFDVSLVKTNPEAPPLTHSAPTGDPLGGNNPVSDTDAAELANSNASPELKNAPLNNPLTGNVVRTQEVANAEKALYNEIAPQLGKAQSSAQPVAPLAVGLQPDIGRDDLDKPNTSPTALEFPEFCSWASVVCNAIDKFYEEPSKPVDAEWKLQDNISTVTPEAVTYTSGIGGGTCPSPKSFTVLNTPLSYSFQPICDLASIARMFVLLFAYLSSIYIVMGVKR